MNNRDKKQEQIKIALRRLYAEAKYERETLRKEFNPEEYEWRVSTEVYIELQHMVYDYNVYSVNILRVFNIKVIPCVFIHGIKLMHCIGEV